MHESSVIQHFLQQGIEQGIERGTRESLIEGMTRTRILKT